MIAQSLRFCDLIIRIDIAECSSPHNTALLITLKYSMYLSSRGLVTDLDVIMPLSKGPWVIVCLVTLLNLVWKSEASR